MLIFNIFEEFGSLVSSRFKNAIIKKANGGSENVIYWANPILEFDLSKSIFYQDLGDYLYDFVSQTKGATETFLYRDPTDHDASAIAYDTSLGIITQGVLFPLPDGVNKDFYLFKLYQLGNNQSYRAIAHPVLQDLEIFIDGISAPFTITGNKIIFNTAPPLNSLLTCNCSFYVPVRFQNNENIGLVTQVYDAEQDETVYQLPNLKLVEVKEDCPISPNNNIDIEELINYLFAIDFSYDSLLSPIYTTITKSLDSGFEKQTSQSLLSLAKIRLGGQKLVLHEIQYLIGLWRICYGNALSFSVPEYTGYSDNERLISRFLSTQLSIKVEYEDDNDDALFSVDGLELTQTGWYFDVPIPLVNTGMGLGWTGTGTIVNYSDSRWSNNNFVSQWVSTDAYNNNLILNPQQDYWIWDLNYTFDSPRAFVLPYRWQADDKIISVSVNGVGNEYLTVSGNPLGEWQYHHLVVPKGTVSINFKVGNYIKGYSQGSLGSNPTGCRVEWLNSTNYKHHLNSSLFYCHAWKIQRTDGVILGATDHDRAFELNNVIYFPQFSFSASALKSENKLDTNNSELSSIIDLEAITEQDLLLGKYDKAGIEIFIYDWLNHIKIATLFTGTLGELKIERGVAEAISFSFESQSLHLKLSQKSTSLTTKTCRHTFGEQGHGKCNKDLTSLTDNYTISSVISSHSISVFGSSRPSGFYNQGKLTFASGLLSTATFDVLDWDGTTFTFWQPMPFMPSVNDAVIAVAGCERTLVACDGYDNVENFGGQPYVPGIDRLVEGSTDD